MPHRDHAIRDRFAAYSNLGPKLEYSKDRD